MVSYLSVCPWKDPYPQTGRNGQEGGLPLPRCRRDPVSKFKVDFHLQIHMIDYRSNVTQKKMKKGNETEPTGTS